MLDFTTGVYYTSHDMEGFKGLEFTAEGKTVFSFDAIPDMYERLDLEAEATNIKVWENGKGFEYLLPSGNLARIQSWEDGRILRLAVAEEKDGNWPVYREPTLTEMVNFLRVAMFAMPNTPRTNVLRAQVEARINRQADTAEETAKALRELSASL